MGLIVQKFGGTSVADIDRIRNVALRVAKTYGRGDDVVVIVSAMSGVTDSLIGLAAYLTSGWKDWGWLFPAGVFGGLAVIVGLAVSGYENAAIGSPLFFGLLIPFVAAYLTNRANNWWALIPGGVMLFLALVTLLVDNTSGEWVGSLFLFLIGRRRLYMAGPGGRFAVSYRTARDPS